MDANAALCSISVLLLVGIYGMYWMESRRAADAAAEPDPAAHPRPEPRGRETASPPRGVAPLP